MYSKDVENIFLIVLLGFVYSHFMNCYPNTINTSIFSLLIFLKPDSQFPIQVALLMLSK